MRRLRVVSRSIFSARLSLSAVSSSTELDAVLASTPSFLRRSMTSWLGRFRSRASWKTLTFPIRLTPLRPVGHALRGRVRRPLARALRRGRPRRRAGPPPRPAGPRRLALPPLLGRGLLFGQAALFSRLLGGQPLGLDAL